MAYLVDEMAYSDCGTVSPPYSDTVTCHFVLKSVRFYGITAIQNYGIAAIHGYSYTAIQNYGNTVIQNYGNTVLQLGRIAELERIF
jgi:hypothetical protein